MFVHQGRVPIASVHVRAEQTAAPMQTCLDGSRASTHLAEWLTVLGPPSRSFNTHSGPTRQQP